MILKTLGINMDEDPTSIRMNNQKKVDSHITVSTVKTYRKSALYP